MIRSLESSSRTLLFLLYRSERTIAFCFFAILLVVGTFIYRDYGLSWDEITSRHTGVLSIDYIVNKDPSLFDYRDKDAGPAFEMFLVGIEKSLGLSEKDTSRIYYTRHLITFLVYYLGIIFFYFLCKDFYADTFLALLGCLMLVVCPRIFAHAFFNSKDIPFMTFTIISMWSAYKFLNRPSASSACLHSFCSSLAIGTRIAGTLMPLITVILFIILAFQQRRSLKTAWLLGLYLFSSAVLVVLIWPALWPNPLGNFTMFLKNASQYPWMGSVFYFGKWLFPSQHELPWHYLPVWMAITIPLAYTGLFIVGSTYSLYQILIKSRRSLRILLSLLVFIIPLALTIALKASVYNEWRHVFFIYPAFVILALEGYLFLTHLRKSIKITVTALICVNIVLTVITMVRFHPYEHFYLNGIMGPSYEDTYKKLQLDLWLVEYKQPFEYIIRTDPRPRIKVFLSTSDGSQDNFILPVNEQGKLVFINNPREANYNIIDFYHINDQKDIRIYGTDVYDLSIEGVKVVGVYKYLS